MSTLTLRQIKGSPLSHNELDGNFEYLNDNKEPIFVKNTAFNKDFGSQAETVCEGNDSRLSDDRTPLEHGNEKHSENYATEDGDYVNLRARATTKNDVGLGNVDDYSVSYYDGRYAATVHTHDMGDIVSGEIDTERLPNEAFTSLVQVNNQGERFLLDRTQVQNGDTVHQLDIDIMFYVVDDTMLHDTAGYVEYKAKKAEEVDWSGVQNKPSIDELNTPTDNTDLNVSISAHGLCPKLSNNQNEFLNGQGDWMSPNVAYSNAEPMPLEVGGISAGTSFSNKSVTEMWDMLLYPELYPTLISPSNTFLINPSGLREVGEIIGTLSFTSSFDRGEIDPAYGTTGYRSGLPNTYHYTGTLLPASSFTTALSDTQSISDYEVLQGNQTWTSSVSYDAGEQPLTNKGNDYDAPLSAGTTSQKSVTITGVYPYFATTSNITLMSKQPLALMDSSYIEVNMVAESDGNKQSIEFSDAWSTITGIQFYNTVSSNWEWIGGSKSNSLTTFNTQTITKTINGLSVNYTKYTHNGSQIGSRQLRWYTT